MLFLLLVVALALFVVLPFIGATLVSILQAFVVGLILGFIARAIVPGKAKLSVGMTALAGIIGGALGRILAKGLHTHRLGELLLELFAAALLVIVFRSWQGEHA